MLPCVLCCAFACWLLAAGCLPPQAGNIPWRALLSRREVWAIILTHFCHNWGLFILLTWMPAYYNQVCVGPVGPWRLWSCLVRVVRHAGLSVVQPSGRPLPFSTAAAGDPLGLRASGPAML